MPRAAAELRYLLSYTVEHLVHLHTGGVPVVSKANDHHAVLLRKDGLIHLPAVVQVWEHIRHLGGGSGGLRGELRAPAPSGGLLGKGGAGLRVTPPAHPGPTAGRGRDQEDLVPPVPRPLRPTPGRETGPRGRPADPSPGAETPGGRPRMLPSVPLRGGAGTMGTSPPRPALLLSPTPGRGTGLRGRPADRSSGAETPGRLLLLPAPFLPVPSRPSRPSNSVGPHLCRLERPARRFLPAWRRAGRRVRADVSVRARADVSVRVSADAGRAPGVGRGATAEVQVCSLRGRCA